MSKCKVILTSPRKENNKQTKKTRKQASSICKQKKQESRPVAYANHQHLNGRKRGRNKGSRGGVMAEEGTRPLGTKNDDTDVIKV